MPLTRPAQGVLFVSIAIAAKALPSCTSGQPEAIGTTWILEHDYQADTLIPPEVTLELEPDGEAIGFYSHLNYKGRYQIEGEQITIDDVCWLSLICQAETNMSGPQDYIETLMNAERYSIEDDMLSIYAGADTLTFATSA
ncbi:MAG: META domain-containing protein [Chloroflexota bacterium]